MREQIRKYPVMSSLVSVMGAFAVLKLLPDSNMAVHMIKRALLSVVMLYLMVFAGEKEVLRWEKGSFWKSVWLYKSMLIITSLVIASSFLSFLPARLQENWYWNLLLYIPYAFLIGLFEESAFRGLLLQGILVGTDGQRRGVFGALISSSLIFGFLHVAPNMAGPLSAATLVQMVSKTLESGMMGFLIGAVYLTTKNIWAVGILHGFGDYLSFIIIALFGGDSNGGYVDPNETLREAMIEAAIIIALNIIPLIAGIRIAGKLPLPQRGMWKKSSEE